ncbi:MAG: ABC transporter substrate-binding protein [Magnetococcales bacterium]|nr:ABC transporter substrate-binding protein [Magnetococcales bacterium]
MRDEKINLLSRLNRRQWIALAGSAVLVCSTSAVFFSRRVVPRQPLTIASSVWPGYELMFLARSEGWMADPGIALLATASATASLAALAAGEANGAALTLDEMLRARAANLPLSAVLVFDVSAGADVVLARSGIETLADLDGKRIGVEQSALGALMLHKVLETTGLAKAALTLVPVTIDGHPLAWRTGQVDALITYEPIASALQAEGGHRIFDSRQIPDTIFDVLAVRTEAIREHASPLRNLVSGHFRALHHLHTNPQDAAYRLSRCLGLPADAVLAAYHGVELPNLYQNRQYLSGSDRRLVTAARSLSAILVEEGLIPQPDDLQGLVNASLLPDEY